MEWDVDPQPVAEPAAPKALIEAEPDPERPAIDAGDVLAIESRAGIVG
jgi:hypothetical protein